MLREETVNEIKSTIQDINKIKEIDNRINSIVELKSKIHNEFNDIIDDLFAEAVLKEKKINLE